MVIGEESNVRCYMHKLVLVTFPMLALRCNLTSVFHKFYDVLSVVTLIARSAVGLH